MTDIIVDIMVEVLTILAIVGLNLTFRLSWGP